MMDVEAEIAALRAEVAQLRAEFLQGQTATTDDGLGGGEGCDVGLPLVPIGGGGEGGAFRWEDGKFRDCRCIVGRSVYGIEDVTATQDGEYNLVVEHQPVRLRIVKSPDAGETDSSKTVLPLVTIKDGVVEHDYRGMPTVQLYE